MFALETKPTALTVDPIPPSAEVRKRLAVVTTEAGLLRSLLRLAQRHEREAERLARVCRQEGADHVA
jgi:hypothetical protein